MRGMTDRFLQFSIGPTNTDDLLLRANDGFTITIRPGIRRGWAQRLPEVRKPSQISCLTGEDVYMIRNQKLTRAQIISHAQNGDLLNTLTAHLLHARRPAACGRHPVQIELGTFLALGAHLVGWRTV